MTMEKIIGREREFELLDNFKSSGKAEFIALFGRRRVGKTFLVRQYFEDKFDFYATGIIDGNREEEMSAFFSALRTHGYSGARPKTWIDMFDALASLLAKKKRRNGRIVVFIDELPCFDTQHSGFTHALDYFWNGKASWMDNMMFVVCGSATSWMIRNIVNNKGGLHNRITHSIHLRPFTLKQVELYAKNHKTCWTRMDMLQMFMTTGGIPYYLSKIDFNDSVANNIDRLFFGNEAEMKDEYNRLFSSLYKNPNGYMEIIRLLCEHKKGLTRNEISEKLNIPTSGNLTRMLDDLQYCDFIRMYNNGTKHNGGIYQVIDFYTVFHNAFCKKPSTDKHFWSNKIGSPQISTFYGLAYERVCMCHIDQILSAMHLDRIHTEYYSWRSTSTEPSAQIDLIIDRADGIISICEIKFSRNEYSLQKDEYNKIIHRAETFMSETKQRKGFQITIITTYGTKTNMYSEISANNVVLDDLFY